MIRCGGAVLQPDDLPPEIIEPANFISSIPGDPLNDEKARFLEALTRSRGNRALAATPSRHQPRYALPPIGGSQYQSRRQVVSLYQLRQP